MSAFFINSIQVRLSADGYSEKTRYVCGYHCELGEIRRPFKTTLQAILSDWGGL